MRLSPVALAMLGSVLAASLAADESRPEDRVIYSSSGVDSAGRRFSMKVTEAFVAGAEWESADVESVALARAIEVAREAFIAGKPDRKEKPVFSGVSLRTVGRGKIVFVKFSVGASWNVSIAVNALFQTIVPEEK